jgi:hypothetical protein
MHTILAVLLVVLCMMNVFLLFSHVGKKLNTYDDVPIKLSGNIAPKVYVVSMESLREGVLTFLIPGQDGSKMINDAKNSEINHILLDGTLYKIDGITFNQPQARFRLSTIGNRNNAQTITSKSTNLTVMILGYIM